MEYDDFPILSENSYDYISKKYADQKDFDRPFLIGQIYTNLEELKVCEFICFKDFNVNLCKELVQTKICISRLIENLNSTFNLHNTKTASVKNINIFEFIEKIFETINILQSWFANEDKEYYKKISQLFIEELFFSGKNILKTLSTSHVQFFKYI